MRRRDCDTTIAATKTATYFSSESFVYNIKLLAGLLTFPIFSGLPILSESGAQIAENITSNPLELQLRG
jgi:hypothetical protein